MAKLIKLGIIFHLLLQATASIRGDEALCPFNTGDRILFIGDSITDMNRGRNEDPNHILGHSYVFLIAAQIGKNYPEKDLTFINRGVSGDGIKELSDRWENDVLALKPNVLSVLVGINDLLKSYWNHQEPDLTRFESIYSDLLESVKTEDPDVKIVLCCPFILPGHHTNDDWLRWQREVHSLETILERLSKKYHACLIALQPEFNNAAKLDVSDDYWIWDGIHPTYRGQQLIADEWMKRYSEFAQKEF